MTSFMLTFEIDIQVKEISPEGLKFRCQFRQINETGKRPPEVEGSLGES